MILFRDWSTLSSMQLRHVIGLVALAACGGGVQVNESDAGAGRSELSVDSGASNVPCETTEECDTGQYCLHVAGESFCRIAECRDTGDCPAGSECHSGLCGSIVDSGVPAPSESCDDGNPCTRNYLSATSPSLCTSEPAPARTECGINRVCRSDGRCVSATRQATCWDDGDCWEGSCIDNVCAEACTTRADCSGGALCENGGCRLGCETSAVCAPGQYCLQNLCRVAECRATSDCPDGSECRSGLCS